MNNRGMTLLESVFAVLILGVGMLGVAGMFPVAIQVQRNTYDQMVGKQAGDSIQSVVEGRGFNVVDLVDAAEPTSLVLMEVHPLPAKVTNEDSADAMINWTLGDRSYPSGQQGDPNFTNRGFYWVPLIKKADLLNWNIYVFVLKKEFGVTYGSHLGAANASDPDQVPIVTSTPALRTGDNTLFVLNASSILSTGDLVLCDRGRIFTVRDADATSVTVDSTVDPLTTKLWYGVHSPSGTSPTQQILVLGNSVVVK